MTSSAPDDVIIVSAHRETLDGLQQYLSSAGLPARGRQSLPADVSSPTTVVVLFPDDFEREEVHRSLRRLLLAKVRTVVVTAEPKRFDAFSHGNGAGAVVIPKPAWGWKILDTIHRRNET